MFYILEFFLCFICLLLILLHEDLKKIFQFISYFSKKEEE